MRNVCRNFYGPCCFCDCGENLKYRNFKSKRLLITARFVNFQPTYHIIIFYYKESTTDQAMLRVCFMLEWYLSFSRWSANQGSEKKVELEAAREHSVLRLIHTSADLAQADWSQVREKKLINCLKPIFFKR